MVANDACNLTPALGFCHVTLRGQKPLPRGYPATPVTIGDHVRKCRMDRELSQPEAAREIGVHFTTLRGWESGTRNPAVGFLPAVIEFLGYVPFPEGSTSGEELVARRMAKGLTTAAARPAAWCRRLDGLAVGEGLVNGGRKCPVTIDDDWKCPW